MSEQKKFHYNKLFKLLDIKDNDTLKSVAKSLNLRISSLEYFNNNMVFPFGEVLNKVLSLTGYSEFELKIRLGILDNKVIDWISSNPEFLLNTYKDSKEDHMFSDNEQMITKYGKLYRADCIELMKSMESNSIDLIFADPPFNLGKKYESEINDYLSEEEYLNWTEEWLQGCIRLLAPGGSLFVYNLPYWQTYTANILNKYLSFRHWVAIYLRGLIPVSGKLHPSHYGLLYYVKGDRPRVFNKQRIPMETCRYCGGEIHDYGGKKKGLDPEGLSIADVWTDINPVRHTKYKNRESNQLPLSLLYRVISLASNEGDVVFDPFGGSGTTYVAAEYLKRKWIGSEIGDVSVIIDRLNNNKQDISLLEDIQKSNNILFTKKQLELREKNMFWTCEKLKKKRKTKDTESELT